MTTKVTVFDSPGSKRTAVARGNVQAHAFGGGAVEVEGAVGLGEGEVAAHLDGPVAAVGDLERALAPARVELDLPRRDAPLRRGPRSRAGTVKEATSGTGRKLP